MSDLNLSSKSLVDLSILVKHVPNSILKLNGSGNKLKSIDYLEKQLNIEELNIEYNNINNFNININSSINNYINYNIFENLRLLNLKNNNLSTINLSKYYLPVLEYLNISNNQLNSVILHDVNSKSTSRLGCINLVQLELSSNNLISLPNLVGFNNLITLYLNNNKISTITDATQVLSSTIEILSISKNKLSRLQEFSFMTALENLKELDIDGNPLVDIASKNNFNFRPYILFLLNGLVKLNNANVTSKEKELSSHLFCDSKGELVDSLLQLLRPGEDTALMKYLQEVLPIPAARTSAGSSHLSSNLNNIEHNPKSRTRVSNISSGASLSSTPKAVHYPPALNSSHHHTPSISPRNNNYQPYSSLLVPSSIPLPNLPLPPTIPLVQSAMFFPPPVSTYGPSPTSYLPSYNTDSQFRSSLGSSMGGYSSTGIGNINIRPFEPYSNNQSTNELYNHDNFQPQPLRNEMKSAQSLLTATAANQSNQTTISKSNISECSVDIAEFQKLQHTVREIRRFLKAEYLGKTNPQESVLNIISKPQRSYISKENLRYMIIYHPTLQQVVELFPLRQYEMPDEIGSYAGLQFLYRCACKIQAVWRGYRTRLGLKRHILSSDAAVVIQAHWRGHMARNSATGRKWQAKRDQLLRDRMRSLSEMQNQYRQQLVIVQKELEEEKESRLLLEEGCIYLFHQFQNLQEDLNRILVREQMAAVRVITRFWRKITEKRNLKNPNKNNNSNQLAKLLPNNAISKNNLTLTVSPSTFSNRSSVFTPNVKRLSTSSELGLDVNMPVPVVFSPRKGSIVEKTFYKVSVLSTPQNFNLDIKKESLKTVEAVVNSLNNLVQETKNGEKPSTEASFENLVVNTFIANDKAIKTDISKFITKTVSLPPVVKDVINANLAEAESVKIEAPSVSLPENAKVEISKVEVIKTEVSKAELIKFEKNEIAKIEISEVAPPKIKASTFEALKVEQKQILVVNDKIGAKVIDLKPVESKSAPNILKDKVAIDTTFDNAKIEDIKRTEKFDIIKKTDKKEKKVDTPNKLSSPKHKDKEKEVVSTPVFKSDKKVDVPRLKLENLNLNKDSCTSFEEEAMMITRSKTDEKPLEQVSLKKLNYMSDSILEDLKYNKIIVEIISSKNLNGSVLPWGVIHPYTVLNFQDSIGQTDIVTSTANPEFNTNFTFPVDDSIDTDTDAPRVKELVIEIKARHPMPTNPEIPTPFDLNSDEDLDLDPNLGLVIIDISKFGNQLKSKLTLPLAGLLNNGKQATGNITLTVWWLQDLSSLINLQYNKLITMGNFGISDMFRGIMVSSLLVNAMSLQLDNPLLRKYSFFFQMEFMGSIYNSNNFQYAENTHFGIKKVYDAEEHGISVNFSLVGIFENNVQECIGTLCIPIGHENKLEPKMVSYNFVPTAVMNRFAYNSPLFCGRISVWVLWIQEQLATVVASTIQSEN